MKIYAIKDNVVGEFGALQLFPRDEVAIRQFNYLMSQTPMVSGDCQLYCLGSYDPVTGIIASKVDFICNYSKEV